MIEGMDPSHAAPRGRWAFWAACGLSAAGGVVVLVFDGASGRTLAMVAAFALAALAFAACALFRRLGRTLATVIFLVAGLAIVYASLDMLAVVLQLTVLGTCSAAQAGCEPGQTQPLTAAQFSGFGYAIALGFLAVAAGFVGLVSLYRSERARMASGDKQA
jgi:uncharacterized membrane protein YhaH (DUF805 family)